MKKQLSTILLSIITLTYLSGCGSNGSGGNGEDLTIPKSVIKNITDNYKVVKGSTLNIDASASTDDVKVEKYKWTIDDKLVSEKMIDKLDLSSLNLGEHKLCLEVIDEDGKSNKNCKTINIVKSNLGKPTAIINSIPSTWKTNCPITLDASSSSASEGVSIVNYQWFKDGEEIGNKKNQVYKFDTNQTHTIALQVTDNKNNFDKNITTISVESIKAPMVYFTLSPADENRTATSTAYFKTHGRGNITLDTIYNIDTNMSDDNNFDSKEWPPTRSNGFILSAVGSYDDCNQTDDNLTYTWSGRRFNRDANGKDKDAFTNCFINRPDDQNYTNVGETVYISLCPSNSYTYVTFTLNVKDNLHNKETNISKTFKTRPYN